jgi:hypothetical protein
MNENFFWQGLADQPIFCAFAVSYDPVKEKFNKIPWGINADKPGIGKGDPNELRGTYEQVKALDKPFIGISFTRPIAISGKQLVCLDLDWKNDPDGVAHPKQLELMAALSDHAYETSHSGKGAHIWVLCSEDQIPASVDLSPNHEIEIFAGVEPGNQMNVLVTDFDATGELMPCNLKDLFKELEIKNYEAPIKPSPRVNHIAGQQSSSAIEKMLAYIPSDDRDDWLMVAMGVKDELGDAGFSIWDRWSRSSSKYDEKDSIKTWESLKGSGVSFGSVVYMAQKNGYESPRALKSSPKEDFGVDPDTGEIIQSFGSSPIASFLFNPELIEHLPVQKGTGKYVPDLQNLYFAISQMKIGFDEFHNQLLYSNSNTGQWTKFTDANYVHVGVALQHLNFSNPSMELIRQLVKAVGRNNTFDSAIDWANSLKWDGVERCKDLLHIYFGVEKTPLSDAASLYMATAMAARALKSDAIVDMVPVLIGEQGVMKSTSVKALAPMPEQFVEIDLSSKDDDISRALRGKLVVELGELKGLKTRAAESIKSWIARQVDEWIPKYQEYADSYKRRCFMVATTNEDDFLTDTTGNRRWIALNVESSCKPDLIIKDRDQIWAEAVAMFKANGVFYKEVQTLAEPVNRLYLATNEVLEHEIQNWLFSKSNPPKLRLLDIMNDLYIEKNKDMGLMKSVARALTSFGYSKKRASKGKGNVWFKECN